MDPTTLSQAELQEHLTQLRAALIAIARDMDRICARYATSPGAAPIVSEIKSLNDRFKTLRVS